MLLIACGGGGGGGGGNSNQPPASPAPSANGAVGGLYLGTFTTGTPPNVTSYDYLLLIADDGEYLAMDPEFLTLPIVGELDVDGSRFEGSRNLYLVGTISKSFGFPPAYPANAATGNNTRSVRGSFVERQSIEVNYYHVSPGSDTQVNATYDMSYEEGSSLQSIEGMYSADDGVGYSLTYVIDSSGAVTGADSTGCTVSGNINRINPNYNLYRTDLAYSNCGTSGANGSGYTGLAILRTNSTSIGQSLYFFAATDLQVVVLELPRI